jgi:hypothetical protein
MVFTSGSAETTVAVISFLPMGWLGSLGGR